MSDLDHDLREQILACLNQKQKLKAIKLYRDATGASLSESKRFVETLLEQLRQEDPESYPQAGTAGCTLSVFLLGGFCFVSFLLLRSG